ATPQAPNTCDATSLPTSCRMDTTPLTETVVPLLTFVFHRRRAPAPCFHCRCAPALYAVLPKP
ncbi:hypothetical protein U1Q18_027296, partial [Sarracenia purpurea var. burkii]